MPTSFGTTTITVTATQGDSTGYAQVDVNTSTLPGTTVLERHRPDRRRQRAGHVPVPDRSRLPAWRVRPARLTVNQTATDVYMTGQIRNLGATFGNFGAQLLDIYVHDPAARSDLDRGGVPDAQLHDRPRRRVERAARGPGLRLAGLGRRRRAARSARRRSSRTGRAGTVTLVVPTSAFGTVGPGWVFTRRADRPGRLQRRSGARRSPSPPVRTRSASARAGGTSPICSVDPRTVPKVMDTITPTGVSQVDRARPDARAGRAPGRDRALAASCRSRAGAPTRPAPSRAIREPRDDEVEPGLFGLRCARPPRRASRTRAS